MKSLLGFSQWMAMREAATAPDEKIPKNLPVEMPIPPELETIAAAFKNEKLKVIDHELKTPKPGIPDKKIVGEKLAGMAFELRSKLKASNNKLYVVGEPVQQYLKHHIHISSQSPEELWEYEGKSWTLATSAHPEVVKLVLMHGIYDHILPGNSKITEKNGTFGVKIQGKHFEIQSFSKTGVGIDGKPKQQYTSRMDKDFEGRNTLYYGIGDKKIYDYRTLISDIESSPKPGEEASKSESASWFTA